jgi:hypothetical protein
MKIHYFQRYHEKENVATANTMLLLSRLYSYSSDKFFRFLKSEYFADSFEPELVFALQEKSVDSIPDATITQEGFKIVVETKLTDWFYSDQLMRHLKSFGDEKNKVMITLASELMSEEKLVDFENQLKEYNATQTYPVIHINTTFEMMANAIREVIDDRDYEMQDVLEDYLNYCYKDGLIPVSDSWKYLRMQLAGTTIEFNIGNNIYYDKAERGFRAHDYLGLYKQKSVRAIGKICGPGHAGSRALQMDSGKPDQKLRGRHGQKGRQHHPHCHQIRTAHLFADSRRRQGHPPLTMETNLRSRRHHQDPRLGTGTQPGQTHHRRIPPGADSRGPKRSQRRHHL